MSTSPLKLAFHIFFLKIISPLPRCAGGDVTPATTQIYLHPIAFVPLSPLTFHWFNNCMAFHWLITHWLGLVTASFPSAWDPRLDMGMRGEGQVCGLDLRTCLGSQV